MRKISTYFGAIGLILVSVPALAGSLHLQVELEIGKDKFTPALTLNENEWVDTEQGEYTLRLRAARQPDESIKVRAEIAKISGTEIELIGRPTVITAVDSAAEVSVADDSGNQRFRLKITPSLLP